MQLLCAGLNGFWLPNHNASFRHAASWSFGVRNVGLRVLDAGLALLRRNSGFARLNAGYAHLMGNAGTGVWSCKPLGLLVELWHRHLRPRACRLRHGPMN